MAYKCEILADSISEQGHRLTTFKITYPRIIHAEMLRHRMLSRNVASSRAIPFEKMVKDVEKDPFIPISWQKNHKGMQGSNYLKYEEDNEVLKRNWLHARDYAVQFSTRLNKDHNVTKQLCNRLLEPFVWTTELVSGTEWKNFFELRCPKYVNEHENGEDISYSRKDFISKLKKRYPTNWEFDLRDFHGIENNEDWEWARLSKSGAEIHIQKIAEMMWDCYNESVPKTLKEGQWHIPYGDNINELSILSIVDNYNTCEDQEELVENAKLAIATARAARISYATLGDNPRIDYEADIKLHDRLLGPPFHASPFEHCAKVMTKQEYTGFHLSQGNNDPFDEKGKDIYGVCGNYRGFIQYRYLIENK